MIHVYDFFSGCGGASRGFQDAGFQINLGIDINKFATATFRNNFPNAHVINKDIRKITPADIKPYIIQNDQDKLLFCGCAPCQPFSKQNRQKRESDSRINLLNEFSRFIKYYMPDYIFVENVPGIQQFNLAKSPLNKFLQILDRLHYHHKHKVISAANYGVPQPRKRLILIACLDNEIDFPESHYGIDRPYSTVADWISGLPALQAGSVDPHDKDHVAASLSPLNLRRIHATPEGGGRLDWPEELCLECHQNHEGHTDVYGRLAYNEMASTLTTRCISYSNGRYGHPVQDRGISIREAACLQTFPREFTFSGSIAERARQIGNAVPPLLARSIAQVFH